MSKQVEVRQILEGISTGGLSVDEGIRELGIVGVVIKVESSEHTNPECDWCYWNTHKVESLI